MRTSPYRRRYGFTLKELTCAVAVGIGGIVLLATVVRVYIAQKAASLRAYSTGHQVTTALNAYFTEYGRFPSVATDDDHPVRGADRWVGDPAMGARHRNSDIFFALRAIPQGANHGHKQNERRVSYFDYKDATVTSGWPRYGLCVRADGSGPGNPTVGALYDPWGREYGIILDTSDDERIDLQSIYSDFSGPYGPRKRVGVFSCGPDGSLGKRGDRHYKSEAEICDDVVSWE